MNAMSIEHTLANALSCLHDVEIALGSLIAERDALRDRVDMLEADGVHSCSTHCQRPMCVLVAVRHEIEAAKREMDSVTATDDTQSDGIGCAENALDRALAALARAQGVQS